MPSQIENNTGRTLAQELKLIRKALHRIQHHPVSPARYMALLSVESQTQEAIRSLARQGVDEGRKAA